MEIINPRSAHSALCLERSSAGHANKFVANPIDVSRAPVYLILYGTGLKQRSDLAQVKVRIDGIEVTVEYAGAQGRYVGLEQVNAKLPVSLAGRGEVNVELIVEGKAANPVRIQIR